jgi:hypothetical protein
LPGELSTPYNFTNLAHGANRMMVCLRSLRELGTPYSHRRDLVK